jgi:hypothetical protein
LRCEFNAPEMGARREKLNSDARALLGSIADIYDPAFLLFLGHRIDERDIRAHFKRLVQVEQAAMRVDHDGLAVFTKLPPVRVLARRAYRYAREDSGAPPLIALLPFRHGHELSCNARDHESTK